VRAAVQGALPHTRELQPLELRFYGASFLVAVGLRHTLSAGIVLEAFIGPGIDLVRYEPVRALEPEYGAGGSATEARPEAAPGCAPFSAARRWSR
jgi:hypothetical protein